MGRPNEHRLTAEELETLRHYALSGVSADRAVEAMGLPDWKLRYWALYKLGTPFGPLPPDKAVEVGRRFREARKAKHLTQLDVEVETSISHPTLSRYENGRLGGTMPMRWGIVKTLAECYGVTPEWLIGEED